MNISPIISGVKPPVRALLAGAIDYAGLFPPSAVSMPEAVLNYATYRNSNYSWMLGRFVVTAARLDEFFLHARDFIARDDRDAWRVSVVVGDDVSGALTQVADFNAASGPGIVCDTVEIRAAKHEDVDQAAAEMPAGITAYFEIAPDEKMPEMVATLAVNGQRAKIRAGGITPDAFPSATEIIRFVRTCLGANVPFKATAGLHHPIRCFRPLTYDKAAPTGTMHGFLNLFLMSGFAREGYKPAFLDDVMEEEFEEVFQFDDQGVAWRDEFRLTTHQLAGLRETGIQSFGSCSFDEPVADLQKLGIL
ncbi:MAG: hypothetical protein WKF34_13275 [Pyrinomonadaceae bacterium]